MKALHSIFRTAFGSLAKQVSQTGCSAVYSESNSTQLTLSRLREKTSLVIKLRTRKICWKGMQQGKPVVRMCSTLLLLLDDESSLSFCQVVDTRLKWDKEEYFDNIKKFDASTRKIYGYQQVISNYKIYF